MMPHNSKVMNVSIVDDISIRSWYCGSLNHNSSFYSFEMSYGTAKQCLKQCSEADRTRRMNNNRIDQQRCDLRGVVFGNYPLRITYRLCSGGSSLLTIRQLIYTMLLFVGNDIWKIMNMEHVNFIFMRCKISYCLTKDK